MSRFAEQTALITGGAQGIGLATAMLLEQEGCQVVLFDMNVKALNEAEAQLSKMGKRPDVYALDVTDRGDLRRAMAACIQKTKRLDILVNCAGITGRTNLKTTDVSLEDFDRVMNLNVTAMLHGIQLVLPQMLKQKYGRIVNIASIAGKDGNVGMQAYSASKAAVIALTKSIGKEYAEQGVVCNALAPAVVRTAMVEALPTEQVSYMTDKIPMKRTGELEEIANMIAFMASKMCSFTTGFTFDATGGRATY